MKRLFLSPTESRLRAGWRLLLHGIIYNLLTICLSLPVILWLLIAKNDPNSSPVLLFSNLATLGAVTLSVFLARRFLDRRSFASLGLKVNRHALLDVLAGFFIAGLMMGLIYLLEWALGWMKFEGFAWQTSPSPSVIGNALFALVIFILVGWNEELLFRGYRLQNLSEGLNPAWGLALSSAWFGVAHILNPNASWLAVAGIYLAGVFLAFGYLRTRQLWLPIGLHIGWNFFEGVVFGFPVSGMEFYRLIRQTVSGPALWTGGAFGPEAGLVILPALLVGALLVYGYSVKSSPIATPTNDSQLTTHAS